jgi:hypothetical protein
MSATTVLELHRHAAFSEGDGLECLNLPANGARLYNQPDQVERLYFLNPKNLELDRPFIAGLYQGEVSAEKHFTPPANWKYLSVEEAVAAYRKIFGSSLKADAVLKLAKEAKAGQDTEGIPIWLKLYTLARLFDIKGDPLAVTDEGREAYAAIVKLFVPVVGRAFTKVFLKHEFKNWQEGQLSAQNIILAPAGRITWQKLYQTTDDDFCFAPAGANTGSNYSGHSVRLSRIKIVLAENQFPQDCIMTGSTIATQPYRMSENRHLGMDCPGNSYSPGLAGDFSRSLRWAWVHDKLHFGSRWGHTCARHRFGAASGRFS